MSSSSRVLFDAPGPKARLRHRLVAVLGTIGILLVLWFVYDRMDQKDQWEADRWTPLFQPSAWQNYLFDGISATLRAAAIAIVISMVLALLLAMARMSDIAPLRWFATVFVEFFRAVPVLIMMIFALFYLSRTEFTPGDLNPLIATVAGLVFYNSAVLCEVIRNGVSSLPAGQREAGLSIGLTPSQTRRTILVPQALTAMLPTLVSQIIVITKDSALGYIILYPELLTAARRLGSSEANVLQAYILVAVLFILINYVISKIAEAVESRQRRRGHTAGPVATAEEPASQSVGIDSQTARPDPNSTDAERRV